MSAFQAALDSGDLDAIQRVPKSDLHNHFFLGGNVMLGRVESLAMHPIRKLYDAGVKVTVNTDDVLMFGQSVSAEFLNLYRAGLFRAAELDEIRRNGLSDNPIDNKAGAQLGPPITATDPIAAAPAHRLQTTM